jgi:hypothetical protein
MARRPTLSDQANDAVLAPEWALIGAVIRQALHDLHSPHDCIRAEAMRFWQDDAAVRYWSDLCGIDLRAVAAHHGRG